MNIKKKIGTCLVGLFALSLAFAGTERMEAAPNPSEINGGPVKLIYDYIGHYELNYTGNTNNYDYWNDSGTSKLVSKTYKDRSDIAENNSSATISKTDSKSKIVKAYLIWETRSEKGVTDSILLVTPNNSGMYVKAAYACKDIRTNNAGKEYTAVYTMAAEVTDLVCGANGGYGTYTVANIPVWNGAGSGVACGGESVASWQLVIVEESPDFPLRTISLNLMSQYFYNVDYTIKVDFADASAPNGEVTASFLYGMTDIHWDISYDGIGYPDDYAYEVNGVYHRYKTQTRGLYKNGVCINNRDTGQLGHHGSSAIGAIRVHLFEDHRRANSAGSDKMTYHMAGTNAGANTFLYGVAIDIFAYDVIFDGNGATSGSMDNLTCVYGRGYDLPKNKFSKEYYEFAGWNTKPDGSGTSYVPRAHVKNLTSTEKSVTLYAQWKPKGYLITLDHQNATTYGTTDYFEWYGFGNYTDDTCTSEISQISVPTKIGNTFGGYYTGANGLGTQYIKPDGTITSSATTFTEDTKLYAKWTPAVYKITLDNQGATSAGTPQYYQKYNIGNYSDAECTSTIARIVNPSKTHYTFQGYFTSTNGEGQRIIDAAGNISDIYTLFDKDSTLYAYWEPVTYTIHLDNQDPTTMGDKKFYEKYGVANYSESTTVTTSKGSKTVTFNYTGGLQGFEAPFDGTYTLTAYGASGAPIEYQYLSGIGGRTDGTIYLKKGERLWINVGGAGNGTVGGYNGGGNGGVVFSNEIDTWTAYGGGGATDFRRDGYALANRIMVAGGGGGRVMASNTGRKTSGGNAMSGYGMYNSGGYATTNTQNTSVAFASNLFYSTTYLPYQDVPSSATAGATMTDTYGNLWRLSKYQKGSLGQGATGAGGGYIGGSYIEIYNEGASSHTSIGTYIVGSGAGTSYIKGVANGVMYNNYSKYENGASVYYYYDTDNSKIADLVNRGNGKATITYTDYNTTTELKEATSITIPAKKGYRFNGYYTGKNGTGTCYVDANGNILSSPTTFTSDTTLYAHWIADAREMYTITFNGNGATSGTMVRMECVFNTNYTLRANGFSRIGYTFTGWNTKANGSGNSYGNMAVVNNLGSRSGDVVTLYAQWTPADVSYTVNHYLEGLDDGWSLHASDTYWDKTGNSVDATWFTKSITGFTYSHAEVKGNPVYSAIVQADGSLVMNLYYTRNSYTVTLNQDIGIESVTGAGAYKYGDSVNINASVLKGYNWHSWVGTYDSNAQKYHFTMPAGDVTMTATTSPIVFTISLDDQRATTPGTEVYYEKYGVGNYADSGCNTTLTTITVPQKTGYTFSGYYTEINGTGTQYITPEGSVTASSKEFIEDTTLYAYWKPITYIIRFEGNGSTGGSMSDFTCTYDEICTLPKNMFTKTQYAFNSWNTKADGSGTTYVNGSSVENLSIIQNDVITLYAQWMPNKYNIHFDANGGEGYMEDITLSYDETTRLPMNAFTRSNEYGSSTFLGWNILADTREILYLDGAEVINATEEDDSTLTLYAIWDDCPWINAADQYYSLDDAKNGRITYDELISHAAASDKEDGENIPAGVNPEIGTSFTIIDYLPTDFSIFTAEGSVSETFQVIDSVGNSYKQRIMVHIVDTEPKEVKPEGTTRFISEEFYYLPYEEGGLEDDSIWKTDPEYVAVIEDAFRRLREDDPEMTFYFTYETILEMKKFIEENGIGKTKHEDALQRFYDEFMEPNMVN